MGDVIKLLPEDLRRLQLIELEMLAEVDRICRKNGIHYSLDGGTLLGAVRHGGFIPWDDDLDVMFLHEDYEKFYEACKTDLDTSRFFFQDYRTDPHYRWGYGKMRRLGTEYVKAGQEYLKQKTGICIDIFDFDNVADSHLGRQLQYVEMYCVRKALYSGLGKTAEQSALKRGWYTALSSIPLPFLHRLRRDLSDRYDNRETQNVLCMMWPVKGFPYGFPRDLFSSFVDLDFEGIKAMAIIGYDEYLRMKYGDYMQLPPEDKRQGVMNAVEYHFVDVTHEEILERYRCE